MISLNIHITKSPMLIHCDVEMLNWYMPRISSPRSISVQKRITE